jgi:hypothetical protein
MIQKVFRPLHHPSSIYSQYPIMTK